jgi:hypothetical protein
MKSSRVKIKVVFTIDVDSVTDFKIFEAEDIAVSITRKVFEESFSRAHLLKIDSKELLDLTNE